MRWACRPLQPEHKVDYYFSEFEGSKMELKLITFSKPFVSSGIEEIHPIHILAINTAVFTNHILAINNSCIYCHWIGWIVW